MKSAGMNNLAKERSGGAYLNKRQYHDWYAKIKQRDDLLATLRVIYDYCQLEAGPLALSVAKTAKHAIDKATLPATSGAERKDK